MFNLISACRLICLGAVMLLAQQARAGAGEEARCRGGLRGVVYDKLTHAPLHLAKIYIKGADTGTYSAEDGLYRLEGICPGTYRVVCRHIGCLPVDTEIIIRQGMLHMDFVLPHSSNNDMEVEVHGTAPAESPGMQRNALTGAELSRTRGATLGDALQTLPGVTSLRTGATVSKPMIHGLQGNRILILNNGIRQEGQQWGSEHAPEVDPFIANRLTVIKGAGAIRYGPDAIGGVVLVEPAALPVDSSLKGEVNLAGYSNNGEGVASFHLESGSRRLPGLAFRVQGTGRMAGNVRTPDVFLNNTGRREANFSAAAGYSSSRWGAEVFYSQFNTLVGIYSGAHIGNLTDLERAMNSTLPAETASGYSYRINRPYQDVSHELIKLKAWLATARQGRLSLVLARQYNLRQEYDKHRPRNDSMAALDRPELRYDISTHTGDLVWEHGKVRGLTGSVGLNGIWQANTYQGRFFIPNFRNKGAGLFWIERWQYKRIEVEGGLRYDIRRLQVFKWEGNRIISPEHSYNGWAGNLGALWRMKGHVNLRLNAGTSWRPPSVNELYSDGLHHGAASIETGDATLRHERAYSLTASAELQGNKRLSGQLDVYANRIDGFINLVPQLPPLLTIRGAFPRFYYVQTDALLYGADVQASYALNHSISLLAKASLVRARDRRTGYYLSQMPADRAELGIRTAIPDKGMLRDNFIQLSGQQVMQQTRLPDNSDYTAAPPAYFLLSAEAGTTLHLGKTQMEVAIAGQNLLNTRYRDYLDRFRYFTDAQGRNISLRVRIPLGSMKNETKNEHD